MPPFNTQDVTPQSFTTANAADPFWRKTCGRAVVSAAHELAPFPVNASASLAAGMTAAVIIERVAFARQRFRLRYIDGDTRPASRATPVASVPAMLALEYESHELVVVKGTMKRQAFEAD